VSVVISAPQLLTSLQYKPFSWREGFEYKDFVSWSFEPEESLTWFVPGFFGWRHPTYWGDWPLNLLIGRSLTQLISLFNYIIYSC
jgi:hypothetical protein